MGSEIPHVTLLGTETRRKEPPATDSRLFSRAVIAKETKSSLKFINKDLARMIPHNKDNRALEEADWQCCREPTLINFFLTV